MKRTKIWSYAFGVTMVLSLAGCGNSAKKQVNEKMNADSMSVIKLVCRKIVLCRRWYSTE